MSSLDHAEFIEQKQKGGLNFLRLLLALLLCAAAGGLGAGAYVTIKCVLLCVTRCVAPKPRKGAVRAALGL
jgi:hypothetical protein